MKWQELELIPLLDLLASVAKSWNTDDVIPNTMNLSIVVKNQMTRFQDGRYRSDRNEIMGFFDAIEKFSQTQLPFTLEHFQALINDYKKRILPYPHYSGIKVWIPTNLEQMDNIQSLEIPNSK